MENEILCAIALNATFGYEPRIARQLIERLGSAAGIFALSPSERKKLLGPKADRLHDGLLEAAGKEWRNLQADGCRFLPLTDPAYPALLKECPDAPAGLYIRSETPPETLFAAPHPVAVIGTRDISPYGKAVADQLVGTLASAQQPPCIVSGLAIGVDIAAHLAALAHGLPTIAVLPVGIQDVYPWRHRGVAARIASSPGCALVSDFPPGTAPLSVHFLRRNRIIAGLCTATILVESRLKGGGMMTARLAAGYGRDVFCVPGRLGDARSEGCNKLIQQKIADIIATPDALPDALGLGRGEGSGQRILQRMLDERYADLPEKEILAAFAGLIRSEPGIIPEELAVRTGQPYRNALRLCHRLEQDGIVRMDLLQRCTIQQNFS